MMNDEEKTGREEARKSGRAEGQITIYKPQITNKFKIAKRKCLKFKTKAGRTIFMVGGNKSVPPMQ
ncbi:MAG: hypothetical protein NT166_08750 [Candidatus Aminicenantes bacterium]|nr:hypothetical protein [Candidatus Aminicenantes bacterium]